MYADAKKKSLEAESYRKELHNLQLQHSTTKAELAAANRKAVALQNDLNLIHSELKSFSDGFDTKFVKMLEEKDYTITQLNQDIQILNSTNLYKDEIIESMENKQFNLVALIKEMRSRLVQLSSSAVAVTILGEREMVIKQDLLAEISKRRELIKEETKEAIVDFASRAVANIIAENDRLKLENKNIAKDLEVARVEALIAEDSIDLKSELMSPMPKNKPTLFTQGTLMLDLPQLFEEDT